MGGKTDAEEASEKSLKAGLKNQKQGVQGLMDINQEFLARPELAKILGLQNQILDNPLTFTPEVKESMANAATSTAMNAADSGFSDAGYLAERIGAGRSQAGGEGLANLVRLGGVSSAINSAQQVERMAAEARLRDLNSAVQSGFGFLTNYLAPRKEVALGQLGSLTGLSSLANAGANVMSQQSGPLDFLGGALGAGLGGFTGGLGKLGANAVFGKK